MTKLPTGLRTLHATLTSGGFGFAVAGVIAIACVSLSSGISPLSSLAVLRPVVPFWGYVILFAACVMGGLAGAWMQWWMAPIHGVKPKPAVHALSFALIVLLYWSRMWWECLAAGPLFVCFAGVALVLVVALAAWIWH